MDELYLAPVHVQIEQNISEEMIEIFSFVVDINSHLLVGLQHALHDASPATTFRYLNQVPYQRSYNFNGRYYTARNAQREDRYGLFCIDDICFSRDARCA